MSKVLRYSNLEAPRNIVPYERSRLEEARPPEPEPEPDPLVVREVILADARREAAEKVREAYAEGYRRGQDAGRAEFLQRVGESAAALKEAAGAIQLARENFIQDMEPQLVDMAVRLAEQILLREIETDRLLIARTARKAIGHLSDREVITLRVHPDDLEVIRTEKVRLTEEFDGVARITVEADAGITPGGCIAESTAMQADARIEAQLSAIYDALKRASDTEEE